jgi:hypothetical protein
MLAERAKQDALLFGNNEIKMSKDITEKNNAKI